MNCVCDFYNSSAISNTKEAIIFFKNLNSLENTKSSISFQSLYLNSLQAQSFLKNQGLKKGDTLLLMELPAPDFYAFILASLAMGIKILILEPWLPLNKIEAIIKKLKPRAFMSNKIGKVWGMRLRVIRKIPLWFHSSILHSYQKIPSPILEDMSPIDDAIITFTSGTSGTPKGVHRKHQYLLNQLEVLGEHLHYKEFTGADLTIFTNVVLLNLANNKTSILISPRWPKKPIQNLSSLPKHLLPQTSAMGPRFLNHLMKLTHLPSLQSLHIGGALTDNSNYEKALKRWPNAKLTHVYGSSEAEPVSLSNLEEAVQKSKDQGYFQTLFLGQTVSQISLQIKDSIAWVSGIHVSPMYADTNSFDNKKNKFKDEQNIIWHNMGDRVSLQESGLWYKGRDFQTLEDFELEQKIYSSIGHSKAFIHKRENEKILLGMNINKSQVLKEFPQLSKVVTGKIYRDPRHRARINRTKSIKGKV